MRIDLGARRLLVLAIGVLGVAAFSACHPTPADTSSGASDGGAGVNGATTGTESDLDLEPICKAFCVQYQQCAPQTNCKLGCMSSAVLACKQEYADDVQCITQNLQGCSGFSVPCADPQAAYQACVDAHPQT